MTEREKFIMRAALIYAQSNLDDLNQAFEDDDERISVNGDEGEALNETEVAELIFTLQ